MGLYDALLQTIPQLQFATPVTTALQSMKVATDQIRNAADIKQNQQNANTNTAQQQATAAYQQGQIQNASIANAINLQLGMGDLGVRGQQLGINQQEVNQQGMYQQGQLRNAAQGNQIQLQLGLGNLGVSQQNADANTAATQQQIASSQLSNNMNKAQLINNTMGGIGFLPADQQAAGYSAALQQLSRSGIDTSSLPTTWGPQAQSAAQTAFATSGNALERYKAQAQLGMQQLGLQAQLTQANAASSNAGLGIAFPNANGAQPTGSPQPLANVTPQQAGAAVAQGTLPATNALQGKAVQAGQEAQAKDWQDTISTMANAPSNYNKTNALLEQAKNNIQNSLVPTGPGIGKLRELLPEGQMLNKNMTILQQQQVKDLANAGVGRIQQSELNMIPSSLFSNNISPQAAYSNIKTQQANNEVLNNITPQIYNDLNNMGIKNKLTAGLVLSDTIKNMGVYNKDGEPVLDNFKNYPIAYQQALINQKLPSTLTQADLNDIKKMNLTPDQVTAYMHSLQGK